MYAQEITGNPVEEVLNDPAIIHGTDAPFGQFTRSLAETACKTADECDTIIESHARNWSISRIAILDRLILRLAITEFLHFTDIPPKVTIDEAIELGKKFSTGKSGRFINGMLDSILTDLLKERRILKVEGGRRDKKSENSESSA